MLCLDWARICHVVPVCRRRARKSSKMMQIIVFMSAGDVSEYGITFIAPALCDITDMSYQPLLEGFRKWGLASSL